jgi:nitroreductase
MEALDAIRLRRSVRKYTGEPIPRTDIEMIIEAGRLAATGGNRQPWDFVVVTEKGMIDQLKVAAEWMDKAAFIIAVVMDPESSWWLEDGSAAVENMLIAATALGYGSCWLEGWTKPREEEFKKLLGIPFEKRLLTLIPIGVPAQGPPEQWPTVEKRSLQDVLRWERYS